MFRKMFTILTIISLFVTLLMVKKDSLKVLSNGLHFDAIEGKSSHVKDALTPESSAREGKNRILLISPLGRAGSSWIGKMLSEIDENTYYVYEPMTGYSKYHRNVTQSSSRKIISAVFSCNFPEWMLRIHNKWPRALKNFRRKCGEDCKTLEDFNKRCKLATTFVIKDIITYLMTTKDLLSMPSLKGLKVIYLVRDPRAQIFSRVNTFFGKEAKLSTIIADCATLNEGVKNFHDLAQLFPGQLYFMRYEDMCLRPAEEAEKLWKFLKLVNVQTRTPETLLQYINSHNGGQSDRPYDLHRNGTTEWNSWRDEMKESDFDFVAVERECRNAMKYSGYLLLNETKNIDNKEIETLGEIDCVYMNCEVNK